MAKQTTRKRTQKPDEDGNRRPYIGWREPGKQQRFNLGKDPAEFPLRYAAIQRLYNDDCQASGQKFWTPRALAYAFEIAAGKKVIEFPAPPAVDQGAIVEYQRAVNQIRKWFPSLSVVPADPAVFGESAKLNDAILAGELEQLRVRLEEAGVLRSKDDIPNRLIAGSFHEALDAYSKIIERDGERLPNGLLKHSQRQRLKMVNRFKLKHDDLPLYKLNFDEGSRLIAFWRKRPKTNRSDNCSRSHSKHQLGELVRFFKWLDQTEQYEWEMPRGLLLVSRKIPKLPTEKKTCAISKFVYAPTQLAVLNKIAGPLERLCLYVGINCGMGAAELGRIVASEVLLSHEHEYSHRLRFKSAPSDNWIRMNRPKTDVFGEWRLWPETVAMLKWAINRAQRLGTELLFVRDNGEPLFDEASDKPDYPFANLWADLLKRAQSYEKGFLKLPFGTLRDTLPDYLRAEHSEEMASMCLAHGRPVNADSLLDCYANRPFGRFHQLLPKVRKFFEPMFKAVDDTLHVERTEAKEANKSPTRRNGRFVRRDQNKIA